jgi:Carboxypeptidase regulatory-like domain
MKACLVLSLLFLLACLRFEDIYGDSANSSATGDPNLDITIDHMKTLRRDFWTRTTTLVRPIQATPTSLASIKPGPDIYAIFFSIWAYPAEYQGHFAKRTLDLIDSVYAQVERHPGRMMLCFSVADIQRAHEQSKRRGSLRLSPSPRTTGGVSNCFGLRYQLTSGRIETMRVRFAIIVAGALLLTAAEIGSADYTCFPIQLKPLHCVCGMVTDVVGDPVHDTKVTILKKDGEVVALQANDDGKFSFGGLQSGTYYLQAEANGFATLRFEIVIAKPENKCKRALAIRLATAMPPCPGVDLVKR